MKIYKFKQYYFGAYKLNGRRATTQMHKTRMEVINEVLTELSLLSGEYLTI